MTKKVKVCRAASQFARKFALACLPIEQDWDARQDNERATYAQGWNDCVRCIEDNIDDAVEGIRRQNDGY